MRISDWSSDVALPIYGEQDHVALVALHGLQVLDEDRFGRILAEEGLEGRIGPATPVQQVFAEALLLGIEGHHADRQLAEDGTLEPPHRLSHQLPGLLRFGAPGPSPLDARNLAEGNRTAERPDGKRGYPP